MPFGPINKNVTNVEPDNKDVTDVKPDNVPFMTDNQVIYHDNRAFSKGQSMGLLLALTYPVAGTWTNAPRL